jgi:hypothetical protein
MITILGNWYDGRTSTEVPAVCMIYDNGAAHVERTVDGRRILYLSRFTIQISSRLANTPRYLYFPDGEKFVIQDNLSVDEAAKRFAGIKWSGWLHRLEGHWRFVLIALAIMLAFMIQDSLLGFALLAITGDATGTSELFLGLPVLLTQLAYSREFEREADLYALNHLQAHGIDTLHFARLMQRLEQTAAARSEKSNSAWTGYLSTHPFTEERIRSF